MLVEDRPQGGDPGGGRGPGGGAGDPADPGVAHLHRRPLSVGFTIANYTPLMAFVCSIIIAVVTFFLCVAGFVIGKTVGNRISGKAEILGVPS